MRSAKFTFIGGTLTLFSVIVAGCTGAGYEASGPRALRLSRHLDGYSWAEAEFVFERPRVYPATQEAPEYLELWLRERHENPIDSIHWYDPLGKKGQPQYDWNVFRSEFIAASRLVARHRWIEQWKAAAKGRRIELQMMGNRSGEYTSWGRQNALVRWRVAGLQGNPAYFISLRGEQSDFSQDLAFGRDDDRAIVYFSATTGEFRKRHWLDHIYLQTRAWEGSGRIYDQCVVIAPSGKYRLYTYSKPL